MALPVVDSSELRSATEQMDNLKTAITDELAGSYLYCGAAADAAGGTCSYDRR